MKIVYAASEAAPYIKTGGLGDVAGALPKKLSNIKGNEVLLFLPYYSVIKYNPQIETEFIKSFFVDLSWRREHVGLFKLKTKKRKLSVYFIDNEHYFARNQIYGEPDDGERFAYFAKAILQSLLEIDEYPDIIHCNDWQTALIPIFLHAFYHDTLGKAKTVFTIHNIEYQGKADPNFLSDTLGLPNSYSNTLMFDNLINFMKGAILSSDSVTTVSKTYAYELRYPYFAHGLADIISQHSFKIEGIVNGIDIDNYNPETDEAIEYNYNINNYKTEKIKNKLKLQEMLGLDIRKEVPLIAMVTRLVKHKGLDLLKKAIYELMTFDIQLVILGTGDNEYEGFLYYCANQFKNKFSLNLKFDPKLAKMIYAASDLYLMPSKSEPCGLSQLIAMRYGSIPIVNCTGGLNDTVIPFNKEEKTGTGFDFKSFDSNDMLFAIRRALEIYGGDKAGFDALVKNAMSYDSSWVKPAFEYMRLYKGLIKDENSI